MSNLLLYLFHRAVGSKRELFWEKKESSRVLAAFGFDLTIMPVRTPNTTITSVREYARLCREAALGHVNDEYIATSSIEQYGPVARDFFSCRGGTTLVILTTNNATNVAHGLAVLGVDVNEFVVVDVPEMQRQYGWLRRVSASAVFVAVVVCGLSASLVFTAWVLLVLLGGPTPQKPDILRMCMDTHGYSNAVFTNSSPTACAHMRKAEPGVHIVETDTIGLFNHRAQVKELNTLLKLGLE